MDGKGGDGMNDDTISRQAAIKHLKKRLIETAINNTGVTALCDSIFEDTAENRIGTWINEVPSAEPKSYRMGYQAGYKAAQRWTPCSEKLPEARGLYLTTTKDKVVYCDYWNEDNFNRTEMVIAWMPLPEPWEGKEQ